jgi:glycosyltransferase involved in cell wall biosynthesis
LKCKAVQVARVLVVLPTLGDRLATLRETLESIDSQRATVDLRLVVVVPFSSSEAVSLARTYGADVVDDPKSGISNAINAGVDAQRGEEFYAWMGDDDLFRPGGLSALVNLLDRNPKSVVSYGACDYINGNGQTLAVSKAGKLAQFLLPWGPDLIPHPGSMIRLSAFTQVGLFDPALKFAMDLDMFLRLRQVGKFSCTKQSVSAFRWHADSLTVSDRSGSTREAESVKAAYLPAWLRPFRGLWQLPWALAASYAARSISRRAARL